MATITNLSELRVALRYGEVNFSYWKKDGSLRHARGTTCPRLIPQEDKPQGKRQPNPNVVTYYDLDKMAWRCCKPALFECYIINDKGV